MGEEPARQDRRRLAAERPLHRAVRAAARRSAATATLLNTPGNSAFANLNGSNTVLGGSGPGNLLLRSDRLLAPRRGRAGQHEAEQRAGGSGLLAARHRRSSSDSRSAAAASPSSGSTRSTRPTPSAGGTRPPDSARRRATRSARSPARMARSASSASADGSCSRHRLGDRGSGVQGSGITRLPDP